MTASRLVDLAYLTDACTGAGRPGPQAPVETEILDGGRTGAEVLRVKTRDANFVLKSIPRESWRGPGMGRPDGGEPQLWRSGIPRKIPAPIEWPVLDLRPAPEGSYDWILMEDVGAGIRDRGAFSVADSEALFAALARMHASFQQSPILDELPLPTSAGTARLFATPLVSLGRGSPPTEEWVPAFLENFQVMTFFAPVFFELLGPTLADAFLRLAADERWKERLDALPRTLLHGDLRRANIAFLEERLALFDWELSCLGHPACDLQWHLFLHYWGYPPEGVDRDEACAHLRASYLEEAARQPGEGLDPTLFDEAWKLGWIRVMSQLGYVLVDPLFPDGGSPEARERTRALCTLAVQSALDAAESLAL